MQKIIIIKLGAKGDVIRTLSILPALKKKFPNSEITWITKEESTSLLKNHPLIAKVIPSNQSPEEKFDELYNFDIDEEATSLAQSIQAKEKYGFYKEDKYVSAYNLGAEYYLNTLFDDDLKKANKKTYQEMMFEVAEMKFNKELPVIFLTSEDLQYAEKFLSDNCIDANKLIGVHMGASSRWPSKAWHKDKILEFISKAKSDGYEILLFGGPNETEKHEKIIAELLEKDLVVTSNNPHNTDREFASLVRSCQHLVCSDSFALHVATALKVPSTALFFCTSPNEVEDYDLIKKLVSPLLSRFFPEKMDQYNEELTKSISPKEVIDSIEDRNK